MEGKSLVHPLDFRSEKLNDYRKQGLFTDVTFLVDGVPFQAHKVILCCQSDVFEAMFQTSMKEAISGEVRITDVSEAEFECFLNFIYTGALQIVSHDRLAQLIYCSEKYGVTELTRAIERALYEHCVINPHRYFDFLPIADMYNLQLFKEAAVKTLTTCGMALMDLSGWYKLASSHFPLAKEIISEFVPNNITKTWNVTPDQWALDGPGQKPMISYPVTLRNHGLTLNLTTLLTCERRTLKCILVLSLCEDRYFDAEMKFKFSVRTSEVLIHSGGGNVWWEVGDGHPQNYQVLFECIFKSPLNAVKNTQFSVEITFNQWECDAEDCAPSVAEGGLSKVYSTPQCSLPENVPVRIGGKEFIVDKIQFSREGSFFSTLFDRDEQFYVIEDTDETTFSKIHTYVSTGFLPKQEQVDPFLLETAKKFDLRELAAYCESTLISKLNPENVVDSLIVASQAGNCEDLEKKALRFINFHHSQVISTDSWSRLEFHPYLIVAIVKTMLSPSKNY